MTDPRRKLILFARYPVAGRVKTRLIPALGAEGAAALHRRLVLRTLRSAQAAASAANLDLQIFFDGGSTAAMSHWLGDRWACRPQPAGDLGQRMAFAFEESFRAGSMATVIIGSDCPALTSDHLVAAFNALSRSPAVFGPATDGGYYLVGLSHPIPELFRGPAWGSETVLADSLRILQGLGLKPALLDRLDDLDRPEDLPSWRRITAEEDAAPARLSVIIPALNEAAAISATLQSVRQSPAHEIILVDGGSADGTPHLARNHGATVLFSQPGRARQMNAGASLASGNVLLFLHADTLLPPGYSRLVVEALRLPAVVAGAFRFQIAGDVSGKWLIESTTNFRSRFKQLPYGDQALFLRRSVFEETGGFPNLPIMEDYEFVRHLRRRGKIYVLPAPAITSGRRWLRHGFLRTTLINKLMIAGFRLGVSPQRLADIYHRY